MHISLRQSLQNHWYNMYHLHSDTRRPLESSCQPGVSEETLVTSLCPFRGCLRASVELESAFEAAPSPASACTLCDFPVLFPPTRLTIGKITPLITKNHSQHHCHNIGNQLNDLPSSYLALFPAHSFAQNPSIHSYSLFISRYIVEKIFRKKVLS